MKKLIILILFVLFTSLLFKLSIEETNADYKGVPVTHDIGACEQWSEYACYFWEGERKGTINFEKAEDKYHERDLYEHEFAHHIYHTKLTKEERKKWRNLSGVYYNYKFKKAGIDIESEYVSEYAKLNADEDFAETWMFDEFGDYKLSMDKVSLKIYYIRYLKEKYQLEL